MGRKVRMKTLAAGAAGVLLPEKVYDLPADQAEALIAGGYAVAAEPAEKAVPPQTAPEPEQPPAPKKPAGREKAPGREKATRKPAEKAVEE